jgi:hypothetical protein
MRAHWITRYIPILVIKEKKKGAEMNVTRPELKYGENSLDDSKRE